MVAGKKTASKTVKVKSVKSLNKKSVDSEDLDVPSGKTSKAEWSKEEKALLKRKRKLVFEEDEELPKKSKGVDDDFTPISHDDDGSFYSETCSDTSDGSEW
ncbi:MAG: hypothetical protein KKD39_00845 [Candidatus Altiarchaeota archaeon]|nr:hypothetical protein [Candidatus Altiarchaeota archaeon]